MSSLTWIDSFMPMLIQAGLFIVAIVIHEISHGLAAFALGDRTAYSQGRLSLNPLKHVDIFGSIILPFLLIVNGGPVFGYAKPVPYNPYQLKNPKRDEVLVGLAGPASNFILAALTAVCLRVLLSAEQPASWFMDAFTIGSSFILINLTLMFFNMIPIPPLDGSSLLSIFIPKRYMPLYYQIQANAMPIFLILIYVPRYLLHFDLIGWYLQITSYTTFSWLLGLS